MSASKRRVEGYDYLYERGNSYEVRVQVPAPLKAIVGKGELKKSLGSDMKQVSKRHPGVLAGFLAQLEAARRSGNQSSDLTATKSTQPSMDEIKVAVNDYFHRLNRNMAGKVAIAIGKDPQLPDNRLAGVKLMAENQSRAYSRGAWESIGLDAEYFCIERGWRISEGTPLFKYLCKTMMEARIQFYRDEARMIAGDVEPDPKPIFDTRRAKSNTRPSTLGDLVSKFRKAREVNWSTSTDKNYIIIFRVIEEICGKDTPLTAIDNDFCINVRNRLMEVPSNYQKRPATRGKSLVEAIEIGASEGIPTISPATINSHLNKLGAIIRYGRDQGWITGNPMAKVEVKDPVADEDKRDPFKVHQLNAIFACEPWASGPHGAAAMERPSRYWAPLISLYSGARLTEICGQLVSEMIEESGVRLFDFRHRPGVRDMKNDKSRLVPVHPELVRLGFWDYVEEARKAKRELLFPDVSRNKLGNWGDPTSKWFGRLIGKLGLTGRALCFHSFRHSFEDALKEIDLHDTPLGNVITGRVSPGVSKNYGSRYTVKKRAEALRKVEYPGLVLPPAMMIERKGQCPSG